MVAAGYQTIPEFASSEPESDREFSVLVLADLVWPSSSVQTSLAELQRHPPYVRTYFRNPRQGLTSALLEHVDAVLIHWSLQTHLPQFIPNDFLSAMARSEIPVVIWRQDEYRWIPQFVETASRLNTQFLISNLDRAAAVAVYKPLIELGCRVLGALPGYSRLGPGPEVLPLSERRYSVGYRVNKLGPRFGKAAHKKVHAATVLAEICMSVDRPFDISHERLSAKRWQMLLRNSTATAGAESGCSVFDLNGNLDQQIRSWRDDPENKGRDEWAMYEPLIEPLEGKVKHSTLGPRIWEAIEVGTALILVPGEYRGILKPGEHYEPLHLDGSNNERIRWLLMNPEEMQAMVERTQNLLFDPRFQYRTFVSAIYKALSICAATRPATGLAHSMVGPQLISLWQSRLCGVSLRARRNPKLRTSVLRPWQYANGELRAAWVRMRRLARRALNRLRQVARVLRNTLSSTD